MGAGEFPYVLSGWVGVGVRVHEGVDGSWMEEM